MNFGPVNPALLQSNKDGQLISNGLPVDMSLLALGLGNNPGALPKNQQQQDAAFTDNAAKQTEKLFGDRIGKHKGFGHDLHKQFEESINIKIEKFLELPPDQQLTLLNGFIKAKQEQALDIIRSQKPSILPSDYESRKEHYDSIYKQILAPKIAEMFASDVRFARHLPVLYGNGDASVTGQERQEMKAHALEVLRNSSASTTPATPQPTSATNLSPAELINSGVAAVMKDVLDSASTPQGVPTINIAKKAVGEFDKIVTEINNQRTASGQPQLTKEEQTALLKQFTDALANHPTGGLYPDLTKDIGTYIQTREQVKAYQDLLAQHKNTNESEFFKGLSEEVKKSIYAAQAQELQKLTVAVATNLGITQEDAKKLLENAHNPSPDVGSVNAITDELMTKHHEAQIAAEQALHNPASHEQKQDVFALLEGNVFNQKFQITNADGTTREVGIRELLDIETKKKIEELSKRNDLTPDEIAKQTKELLEQQNKINTQLDQAYAAAIYQKRYQQAYDKALQEAGGQAGGEAAIKAAEAAGLKAGQAAFKYLSDPARDQRGSLKDFNPAQPSLGLINDIEQMAYLLRAFIGQPIEANAKPAGSQA